MAVLRERNIMALAVAPVMPATSTADAIQALVTLLFPARAPAAIGAPPVGTAVAPPAGPQTFALSPEALAALGARGAAAPDCKRPRTGSGSIVHRAEECDDHECRLTHKRPDFIAPCDITRSERTNRGNPKPPFLSDQHQK